MHGARNICSPPSSPTANSVKIVILISRILVAPTPLHPARHTEGAPPRNKPPKLTHIFSPPRPASLPPATSQPAETIRETFESNRPRAQMTELNLGGSAAWAIGQKITLRADVHRKRSVLTPVDQVMSSVATQREAPWLRNAAAQHWRSHFRWSNHPVSCDGCVCEVA